MSELHTHEEPQVSVTKSSSNDTLIQSFVDRIERAMIEEKHASDDLKAIVEECKEHGISKEDILSMKTVAKLRMKDQAAKAREKLESLERISRAVKFDLFSWSEEFSDR